MVLGTVLTVHGILFMFFPLQTEKFYKKSVKLRIGDFFRERTEHKVLSDYFGTKLQFKIFAFIVGLILLIFGIVVFNYGIGFY
ncbi:MAG: hypothetical protein R2747_04075 [Pyrinomonadaceae bacterium]